MILYTTGCHRCRELSLALEEKGIEYEVCTDVQKMLKLGFTMVPMLQVGEDILDYEEAMEFVKDYKKGGEKE